MCLLYFYCYSTCPVYSTCPIVCDSSQQNVGSPQANICCVVCHSNILCLLYFYCYSTCPVACFLYSTCPIVCDSSQQNVGSPQANICCAVCHSNILYFYFYYTCPVACFLYSTCPIVCDSSQQNVGSLTSQHLLCCVSLQHIVYTLFLLLLYLSCCLFSLLNLSSNLAGIYCKSVTWSLSVCC